MLGLNLSLSSNRPPPFNPIGLFRGGEAGVWYDPSDLSTLFQDTAGTVPVTAVEQPVGLMLDKIGNGNHATQPTATSRPVLSARVNLLTATDTLVGGGWNALAQNTTVTSGYSSPLGENTAARVQMSAASASLLNHPFNAIAGHTYRLRFLARRGGTSTRFSFGFSSSQTGGLGNVTVTNLGDVWQEFFIDYLAPLSGQMWVGIDNVDNGQEIDVLIAGIDLRLADAVPNLPPYQRVTSNTDYDTVGFPYYLRFDGVDDGLVTPTITPGTDKVQVFAGVRKLSDASAAPVVELSASASANSGSFGLFAPASAAPTLQFASRGTTTSSATFTGAAAPTTSVLTGLGSISDDSTVLRINGTQAAQNNTLDQGTGNYLDYPLYIGRRAGATLPFNGHLYSLIVRFGSNLPIGTIERTEKYINRKTRAY